ncbi:MAG: DinB family protein [Planctomycetota bacterium]
MKHVIGTQRHYLFKMRDEEPERAGEGEWSLARCREEASKVAEGWLAYLGQCSDADLERTMEQRRSGKIFEIKAIDVLTHVITHSFHHRAQLNLLLRHAGRNPPRAGYAYLARRLSK